jgi:hypothetical protein
MAAAVATFDPTNARCAFEYTVPQNANADRKRAAIADTPGGDVRIAQDHELVTALGHLLPAPAGGKVTITMHLVEFLIMSLVIFHQDLDTMAPNWFIKLSWLSALWAAMMNAGMESGRAEHPQQLRSRIHSTMQALSDTDRTLRTADVIVNSKPTGTWWEHISPRRLRAGDAFNTVFSQLRNMVTGHWGEDAHEEDPFQSALDLLVPTPFAQRTPAAQAAGVIAHMRRTTVRQDLDTYVEIDCANDEVGRRLQDTAEAAFIPLFERSWTTAFPELKIMLPACTNPQEVVLIVKGLLPRVNLQSDFTDANTVAFCKAIRNHLSNVASAPSTKAGQDARIEQLMGSVRTEITQGAATARKEVEAEQVMALYQRQDFQTLNTVLEGLQTLPLDGKAVVLEMFTAASAAGWMQLAGSSIPQKAFRTMRGLSADKGINTIHEYLNSRLATNSDGSQIDGAGTLISEKVAKNTVHGNISNGDGKDQINYWNDIALQVVIKREGYDAVQSLAPLPSAADFFLDPPRMELALDVITTWFAAFGYDGSTTGSVNTTLRNINKTAKVVLRMRDTEPRKPGLLVLLRDAANSIFAEFSTSIKAMLAGPIGAAVRPVTVMLPHTTAAASWAAAQAAIVAVGEEHKKTDVGLGRPDTSSSLGFPSPAGQHTSGVTTLSKISVHSSGQFGGSEITPADSASQVASSTHGMTFGWGHLSHRHGIYEVGSDIAFGSTIVSYTSQIQLPTGPFCWAPYAPDKQVEKRGSWCTRPATCKSSADHERPAGLTQDMIKARRVDKIEPGWKCLFKAARKRGADGPPNGGKGRGKGKGGGRGRRGGRGFQGQQ